MLSAERLEPENNNEERDYEMEIEHLRRLAYQDELTELGNRRAFNQQLRQSLAFASRYGGTVSLIVLDLDRFKNVNDKDGHPIGDKVLRRVGAALQSAVREADHAARLGGDEFAVILPNTDVEHAIDAAERLREQIESLLVPGGRRVTASLGVAMANDFEDPDELYSRADQALYRAKAAGGNCTKIDVTLGASRK